MRSTVLALTTALLTAALIQAFPSGAAAQAATAPTANATPPQKMIFLIREPDGGIIAIRTVSLQSQGPVLVLTNEKGGRVVVQSKSVLGQLPWYTAEELASGSVDLGSLITTYDLLALRVPSQRRFLEGEAARFRTLMKAREDEEKAKEKAIETQIQTVTSPVYNPASGYTAETLEGMLRKADEVSTAVPDAAERIEQWAVPFRDHLSKLKAGNRYEKGAWVTAEEIARREQVEREAAFLKGLNYEIDPLALPAKVVHETVTKAVVATGLIMAVGLGLLLFGSRGMAWRTVGFALFFGGPAALAVIFFLATRSPASLPLAPGESDAQPVVAALAEAAGVNPAEPLKEHVLSEASINAFLARQVHLRRMPAADGWIATREALNAHLSPKRLSIFDLVHCLGMNWIVRYDISFPSGALSVNIGDLECPTGIAQALWKSLEPQLLAALMATKLTERFVVQAPADGTITLTPIGSAPAVTPMPKAAPAAQAPSATPAAPGASISPSPTPIAETAPTGSQSKAPDKTSPPTP